MRNYNPNELPVDQSVLNETPLQDQLNIEQLVFRQIERTALSALQDEALFASNVRILLSMVPANKREQIEDRTDEYTSEMESWQYKYFCGVPLGTPEEPINNSPYLVKEPITDWHMLFEIILASYEEAGITWHYDKWLVETGKLDDKKQLPMPTPVFDNTEALPTVDNQTENLNPELPPTPKQRKRNRPCAICGKHVESGTGQFYKHKLVHKDICLNFAEQKWENE